MKIKEEAEVVRLYQSTFPFLFLKILLFAY